MATRISLTMIVKNERGALPGMLEAARPWVDEIIVVDTGSTDGTQEIARSFGASVFEWAWRDDFAAARNESLRHATGDWALALDADETLTPESGPALRRACEAPDDIVGYNIKIVCPRHGDGGLVRLNWFPRLFRRLPDVRWEGVIHEQIIGSLVNLGRIEPSEVEVLHSGYTLSPEQMAAKAERNSRLLERQLQDEPDYAPGWFQLAETYVMQGECDKAIDAYQRCLRLLEVSRLTLGPGVVAVALQNLGGVLVQTGKLEEGRRHIEAALTIVPDMAPAYLHLGQLAMREEKWSDAEQRFAQAIEIVERQPENGEFQVSPWLIHFLRGAALARQKNLTLAIESFEASLTLNPDQQECLWFLALAASDVGDLVRSAESLKRLAELGRDGLAFHVHRAEVCSKLGRHAEAAEAAQRALDRDAAAIAMLAIAAESLAVTGRYAEAVPFYARLAEANPDGVGPLLALAQCQEALGNQEAMMAAYRKAVALEPESAQVLFALGSACLRGGAFDAAEECLGAAVACDPDRPEYRLNHALCLLKRGDLFGAQEKLTELVARWPEMSQARTVLASLGRLLASASLVAPALEMSS